MLRKEKSVEQFSFKIYLYIGVCSNCICCTRALFEPRKISFLSQTSVKISRKAFYQVFNNEENSSYGTVQYSFYQQKRCLELFREDMKTSLLRVVFEIRMKNQDFFKSTTSVYYFVRIYLSFSKISPLFQEQIEVFTIFLSLVRRKNCAMLELLFFWSFSFQME